MQVGRPPGGFNIIVLQHVRSYIKSEIETNHRVGQFWSDILDRIKITGLREGTRVPGAKKPTFLFVADGSPDFKLPTIQLVYECFAADLTVTAALVWQDADYEPE